MPESVSGDRLFAATFIFINMPLSFRHLIVATGALCLCVAAFAVHPGADTTFGNNGLTTVATPGYDYDSSRYTRAFVDGSGRTTIASMTTFKLAISRVLANGTVDPSFNAGAARIEDVSTTAFTKLTALGADSLGRTIIAGGEYDTTQTVVVAFRLTASGALDTTFGVNGRLRTVLPVNIADGGTVPVVPKQVVARAGGGYFLLFGPAGAAAFDASGALDGAVWQQGVFQTDLAPKGPNAGLVSRLVGLSPAGEALVLEPQLTGPQFYMRRVRTDGTLDPAYGALSQAPFVIQLTRLAKFDASGRMYVLLEGSDSYAMARLSANGLVDTTYGVNGFSVQPVTNYLRMPESFDVASDGRAVLSSPHSNLWTAVGAFRMLLANGSTDTAFGGLGVSRVQLAGQPEISIEAQEALFATAGNRLVIHGAPSYTTGIVALSLKTSFTHRITASNPIALPSAPTYGDNVALSFDVMSDQMRPIGQFVLRNNASTICIPPWTSSSLQDTLVCGSNAIPAGASIYSLEYSGDDMYLPMTSPSAGLQVARARFTLGIMPRPTNNPQAPKDKFPVALSAVATNNNHFYITSAISGTFEITDGDSVCSVPAGIYAGFPQPECQLVLKTPGNVRLFGRHVGDPNFEVAVNGQAFVNVGAAQLSLPLTNWFTNKTYRASISSNDAFCGLKYVYEGLAYDQNIPPGAIRAQARNGSFLVQTVTNCDSGFSGNLVLVAEGSSPPLAAAWVVDASNNWRRIAAVNQQVLVPFLDNGLNDLNPATPGGEVLVRVVLETAVNDAKCIFDVYSTTPAVHGRALLMLAAGFRYSIVLDSLGSDRYEFDSWWERVSCPTCGTELDLNANGQFDVADAQVILRRMQGLSAQQATSNVLPVTVQIGSRSATEVQSFIENGCK